MIDSFGREITYLRLSVTDRCNLRCFYCMPEDIELLPRDEVLTIEETVRLATVFARLGVRKLRLTGGEPLVRHGIDILVRELGALLADGELSELTLTTNGIRLPEYAGRLYDAGIRRVNVSLDSLDPETFRKITGRGEVEAVLKGIAAATDAGLAVKINTVVLKNTNEDQIDDLIRWCGERGHDITLIETMPLGRLADCNPERHVPLDGLRRRLESRWSLLPNTHQTGGPAHFVTIAETGRRLGLISALSHSFCSRCNRVRLTCTGSMTPCLGQEKCVELRPILRASDDDRLVEDAIVTGIAAKPRGHTFALGARTPWAPAGRRSRMCRTGG